MKTGRKPPPRPPSGKSQKVDERRQIILEAAIALFSEHGYDRISVNNLAKVAGVSKSTIYNNFQGKADILRESAAILSQRLWPPLPCLPSGSDPRGALMALARWLQRASSTPEFIGFYRLCISEARRFPAVARFGYTSISDGLIKPCEVVFATFGAEQLLRIPDAEVAAEQFFGAVVGPCLWSQALGAPLPEKHLSEQHLRQVVDMFLRIPPQTTTLGP